MIRRFLQFRNDQNLLQLLFFLIQNLCQYLSGTVFVSEQGMLMEKFGDQLISNSALL